MVEETHDYNACIVTMPIYDCNLWNYLKSDVHCDIGERFEILSNVLGALQYIQQQGCYHLDVKPSNILLNLDDNGSWNKTDCVLTDFGTGGNTPKGGFTPVFASPEVIAGKSHAKSDNYSFGKLIIMSLFSWTDAWRLVAQPVTDDNTIKIINENMLHNISQGIQGLLRVNPEDRSWLSTISGILTNASKAVSDSGLFQTPFPSTIFNDISENTQASVFMQRDIESMLVTLNDLRRRFLRGLQNCCSLILLEGISNPAFSRLIERIPNLTLRCARYNLYGSYSLISIPVFKRKFQNRL